MVGKKSGLVLFVVLVVGIFTVYQLSYAARFTDDLRGQEAAGSDKTAQVEEEIGGEGTDETLSSNITVASHKIQVDSLSRATLVFVGTIKGKGEDFLSFLGGLPEGTAVVGVSRSPLVMQDAIDTFKTKTGKDLDELVHTTVIQESDESISHQLGLILRYAETLPEKPFLNVNLAQVSISAPECKDAVNMIAERTGLLGTTLASGEAINFDQYADNQIITLPGSRVVAMDPNKMRELYDILENPKGRVVAILASTEKQKDLILGNFREQGLSLEDYIEITLSIRVTDMDISPLESLFDTYKNIADCTLDKLPEATRETVRQV